MISKINLSQIIAKPFHKVHNDIKQNNHTYYDLSGGRGSTKSSFISIEIILGIMNDEKANAIVYRKVGNTLRNTVFEQILWAIDTLNVSSYWRATTSPLLCEYLPTGQKILFRGLDDPMKSKSIKLRKGYFKFLWFEELDEFNGIEEIRSIQQSVLRGGSDFVVFKSFNPPITNSNWANLYVSSSQNDSYRHHSTYLDVPDNWLGKRFIDDAITLKQANSRAYEHEYLGLAVGTGGNVFENAISIKIPEKDIAEFDRIYMGIDWGWYPDPFTWNKMHFDSNRRILYIFDELHCNKKSNRETADMLINNKHVTSNDLIIADSAENKSVGDYRSYGLSCRAAQKGAGSVDYSIKWLQSLNQIIIDESCKHTAKEFLNYEYERNKEGEIITGYPDKNNHHIDAVRYAMSTVWKKRGQ